MRRRNRAPFSLSAVSDANPQETAQLPPELYFPLWWYSGGVMNDNNNAVTAAGSRFVQKGTVGPATAAVTIFTLSASANPHQKYALEAAIYTGASGYTASAELWDVTTNSAVSGSQISTSSTTAQVFRSSQFTLTPGHSYGITIYAMSAQVCNLTDASLIAFPNQQLLAQDSLANITLGQVGQKLVEAQLPLWVHSISEALSSGTSATSSTLLEKGTTSVGASTSSAANLITLSSNWSKSQLFALEVSMRNAYTALAALWDITANSEVTASQVSVASGTDTSTLIRSGSFQLTPGHSYGVVLWQNGGGIAYLTKAQLVALF